jgi:iron complex transport system permease protein
MPELKHNYKEKAEATIGNKYNAAIFITMVILLAVVFILDLFLGSVSIKVVDVLKSLFGNSDSAIDTIIMKFRFPKAITSLMVGFALSLSGLQMQTLFRNPLAGPDVLGVSSGASLGVAIVILGFAGTLTSMNLQGFGNWLLVISACTGAGAVMLLIMFISSRVRDIMTILILGIMLASGISAIVSIMQYFSNETMLKSYVIWTMGSLGNLSSGQLKVLAISVSAGIVISIFSVKMLNALLLGESYAGSVGLNVRFSRTVIFSCTSILAGSVTAFCGPVGFIGIAVPHIARNIFKTSDHAILVPGSLLAGGIVMIVSDIIAQLPGSESVLPINSVTSLIGIPIVIWVILRNRRNSGSF